ncbi:hypothetical protein HY493_03590 [Candidatus Woesearchaeota archaeon]|nr:hypothetical protein [Candidatus Woesearchaeota archaeon]
MDNFLISEGFTPYVDFFEHHPLFQNFLLAPVFWTGNFTLAFLIYHLLGLAGVALTAWLVYRIACRNGFRNPHSASLFFLVGYTGLIVPFLRYEFWSMLFLLGFFAFSHPFIRGLSLALLGATSPIVFFATGAMAAVYYVTTFLHDRKAALIAFGGSLTGVIFWLALHRDIPLSAIYYAVVTFNNTVGHLYAVPWQEVTFFTFVFVLPILALALLPMLRAAQARKDLAVLGLVFMTVFILQIITMNFVYGPFSRIKLPAPIPILVLAIIFLATYRTKFARTLIIGQLLLTLFVSTPSFALPELDMAQAINTLDRCVAPNARIMLNEDPSTKLYVPLFRQPNEYYWFLHRYYSAAGITYVPPTFEEPLSLCGNTLEKRAWTCTSEELATLQEECDALLVPNSAWQETRAFITGRRIATRELFI